MRVYMNVKYQHIRPELYKFIYILMVSKYYLVIINSIFIVFVYFYFYAICPVFIFVLVFASAIWQTITETILSSMPSKKRTSIRHNIWVVPFSPENQFYGNFRITLIDYGHTVYPVAVSLLCGDNDDDE